MKNHFRTLLTLLIITSCAKSYDFGEATFDEVFISDSELANPTWNGSVSTIIEEKCANCHTTVRDQYVPANTPTTIDRINEETFTLSVKATLRARILSDSNPMPPLFATPLSSREKAALATYLQ